MSSNFTFSSKSRLCSYLESLLDVGPAAALEAASLGESLLVEAASGECLRFLSEDERYFSAAAVDVDSLKSLAESLPQSDRRSLESLDDSLESLCLLRSRSFSCSRRSRFMIFGILNTSFKYFHDSNNLSAISQISFCNASNWAGVNSGVDLLLSSDSELTLESCVLSSTMADGSSEAAAAVAADVTTPSALLKSTCC